MNQQLRPLGGRGGTPEDVTDAVEYLASDLAKWISGQSLLVAGGAIQYPPAGRAHASLDAGPAGTWPSVSVDRAALNNAAVFHDGGGNDTTSRSEQTHATQTHRHHRPRPVR